VWVALTNFGERLVQSARLAEILGRPVGEAEALARQFEDGLITVNPERAEPAARRQLQIGDRRVGMTGCAPDIFLYARWSARPFRWRKPARRPAPIRIVFTPSGVESVDPAGAVVPILPPREFDRLAGMTVEDIDASMCA